jgi:hypothetical protein
MKDEPEFKIGDEVYLEKGVEVYTYISCKYVYSNRPFDESLTLAKITLGLLYTNEEITKRSIKEEANHITNIIFSAFISKGYEIAFNKCKEFVNKNIDVNKKIELTKFILSEGTFVITDVIYHPETTGRDSWPAYYEFCAERKNGKDKIQFVNWQYYNNNWHFINEQQPIK